MENDEIQQGADYGALQSLLEDDEVEEIWINSPQRIFIARSGKSKLDLYGRSLNQFNGDIALKAFICDGKSLSVTLQQVHQLPFKLRVFGITEFTNQIEVSMESIYQ